MSSTVYSKQALVFLYPVVPFRGSYPLEDLNARMRAMAQRHRLVYPAFRLRNPVGHNLPDPAGTGGVVRQSDGTQGILGSGPSIPLITKSLSVFDWIKRRVDRWPFSRLRLVNASSLNGR